MNLKHSSHHPKPHRTHITPTPSVTRSQIAKRRSNRILLTASVGLSGEDRQKCSFTVPAIATNLNKHGAVVQLSRDLMVGSAVSVRNKQGIQVPARVVSQLTARQGVSTYGIEFIEPDDGATNFWGIAFPPSN